MPAFDPVLGRIRDERRLHNTAWYGSYEYLYHEHHERTRRISKQITYDKRRRFCATALPYTSGGGLDDIHGFKSKGHLGPGHNSVYYSDGAHRSAQEEQDGLLASAVAWRDGSGWETKVEGLPRYSGETKDAELYALKMAFDIAVQHASDPDRSFENVVIFSDCQDIIQMLAGEGGSRNSLGPIPTNGRWALEDVYDAAKKLQAVGKKVVVAWIKGHRKGIGREGNHMADHAAGMEIKVQLRLLCTSESSTYDFPEWAKGLEGDVREEALWRLSKPFFRWGAGSCWISPSLQMDEVCDEPSEEEDWTVYRPVMTLRQAKEEDARELKKDLAKKYMESRPFLPRKDATHNNEAPKAALLRHLWRHTKALPKPPKVFDYGKLYKKSQEQHMEASSRDA